MAIIFLYYNMQLIKSFLKKRLLNRIPWLRLFLVYRYIYGNWYKCWCMVPSMVSRPVWCSTRFWKLMQKLMTDGFFNMFQICALWAAKTERLAVEWLIIMLNGSFHWTYMILRVILPGEIIEVSSCDGPHCSARSYKWLIFPCLYMYNDIAMLKIAACRRI